MEKRVLLLVLLMLMLSYSVYAISVSLGIVDTSTNDITFSCTATEEGGESITNLTLYHNKDGWGAKETNTTGVISGTSYSFTTVNFPNGNYIWNCLAVNYNAQEFFAASNGTFTINVNSAPLLIQNIPDFMWEEDNTYNFNISAYFTDPNKDSLTYSHTSVTNIGISISNDIVTFTPIVNWSGTEIITFTASDGILTNTSNNVILNVTDVNDPPLLINIIENQTWYKNSDRTIDLGYYFKDIDSKLTYSSDNISHFTIEFDQDNEEVTLTPENDWIGSTAIIFRANDSNYTVESNVVNLTIKDKNVAPKIDSYSPEEAILTIYKNEDKKFSITKSDLDNDNLNVKWYIDDVLKKENEDNYTFLTDNLGIFTLKVVVSDGNLVDTQLWTVSVIENFTSEENVSAPAPVISTEEKTIKSEPKCGNEIIEEGENCENCPQDAGCTGEYKCINQKCVLEIKTNYITILIVVGILIGAAIGAILYYNKKKKEEYGLEDFEPSLPKEVKEQPALELDDFYKQKKIAEKKSKPKTVAGVLLKNYIRECLERRGHSLEKIRSNLLSKGWKKEQVEEALAEFEVDKITKDTKSKK